MAKPIGRLFSCAVVTEPGASVKSQELAAWCAETLAPFKVPSLWEIRTESLPRNASGKILKNVLTGEVEVQLVED